MAGKSVSRKETKPIEFFQSSARCNHAASDDRHTAQTASPSHPGGMAGKTAERAASSQATGVKQRKVGSYRSVEEERVLAELDRFRVTARAKDSKATSRNKAPSGRRDAAPAPFDPLFELETLSAPMEDQDWQSMLQGVFEMETQSSLSPCQP